MYINQLVLDYRPVPEEHPAIRAVQFNMWRETRPAVYWWLTEDLSFCVLSLQIWRMAQGHKQVLFRFLDPLSWDEHTITATSPHLFRAMDALEEVLGNITDCIYRGTAPPKSCVKA